MDKFGDLFDKATLGVFRLCAGGLGKKLSKAQYEENKKLWDKEHGAQPPAAIDCQAALTSYRYGRAGSLARRLFFDGHALSAADNACEVIAVYNALRALGRDCDLPSLLKDFSEKGICLNGVFGTSPASVAAYLKRLGFSLTLLRGAQITSEALNALAADHDAFIFSAFNKARDPFSMVHTMCITKDGGRFTVHNEAGGSRSETDLSSAVLGYRQGSGHAILVIGIRK